MYLNRVTLTGFIGGDGEIRTSRSNVNFTVFSLATKNSWRDRKSGERISRTEWHRAVVFGRLSAFAATLKKGDHVQIQGQLRSRLYEKPAEGKEALARLRVTQIRVISILKLDQSWKQNGSAAEGATA
jgi:single-strand DNA-binding protein